MNEIKVFDMHRIFFGDTPILFLLEIVFRTTIMYSYTIVLLRLLGKRGMGQLSTLELAIIISFGSAVGDPMMGVDIPIFHGMVVITTIALLQVALERYINQHKKAEELFEGTPDCLVDNGIIQCQVLEKNNLSCEDLFRSLRAAQSQHLGQINKSFFETSGVISVLFKPKHSVQPGLSLIPFSMLSPEDITRSDSHFKRNNFYSCIACGYTIFQQAGAVAFPCPNCNQEMGDC